MKVRNKIVYAVVATAMGVNLLPVNVQAAPLKAPIVLSQSDNLVEYEVQHILDVGPWPIASRDLLKGKPGEMTKAKAKAIPGYHALTFQQQIVKDGAMMQIHYAPNQYTIKFDGNGATSGTMSSILTPGDGTSALFPECAFTKTGYKFAGWAQHKTGVENMYKPGNKISFVTSGKWNHGDTVTVYARWEKLETKADYTQLNASIAKANALVKDRYKDFSAVEAALNAVVKDKPLSEQSVVHGYTAAIEKAIAELELKDADYTKVNAAIAEANALVKANYKDFSAVEAAVNAVVKDKKITEQAVVDGYATAITNAIAGLELKDADYTKVNSLLNAVKKFDKTKYTDFSAVEAAVNAVVKGKKITEQATVDAYATAIETALDGLVEKTVEKVKISFVIDTTQGWICDENWNDVDQGIEVEKGKKISFHAGAEERFIFQNITLNNTVISTTEDFAITTNADVTLKVNFIPATVTVGLSTNTKDFGTVLPGYNPIQAEKIALENTGNITLFLLAPEAENFELSGYHYVDDAATDRAMQYVFLEPGEKVWFTIRPKDGLAKGTYNESIKIYESLNRPMALNPDGNSDLNELATLNAKFTVDTEKFDVNTSSSPLEGGITTGDGTYEKDAMVQVTAKENAGYEFVGWQEDGEIISTQKELSFKITEERNLLAVFKEIEKFDVNTSSSPLEGGTTTGDGTYAKDAMVQVTAKENANYEFVGWQEDGKIISTQKELSFKITEERNLLAVFEKKQVSPVVEKFVVRTNANPTEGGITKGAGVYKKDETVCVSAEARKGFKFAYWLEDGKVVSDKEAFTFKATKDRNLLAVFNKVPAKKVVKAKTPTGLSTNVFSWISLAGLSAVAGTVLLKKKKNNK